MEPDGKSLWARQFRLRFVSKPECSRHHELTCNRTWKGKVITWSSPNRILPEGPMLSGQSELPFFCVLSEAELSRRQKAGHRNEGTKPKRSKSVPRISSEMLDRVLGFLRLAFRRLQGLFGSKCRPCARCEYHHHHQLTLLVETDQAWTSTTKHGS